VKVRITSIRVFLPIVVSVIIYSINYCIELIIDHIFCWFMYYSMVFNGKSYYDSALYVLMYPRTV
jgi:hypothetical protein